MNQDLSKLVESYKDIKKLMLNDADSAQNQALALTSLVHKFYKSDILSTSLGQTLKALLDKTEAKAGDLSLTIVDGKLQLINLGDKKMVDFLSPIQLVAFIKEEEPIEEQLLIELFLIDGSTLLCANAALHLE